MSAQLEALFRSHPLRIAFTDGPLSASVASDIHSRLPIPYLAGNHFEEIFDPIRDVGVVAGVKLFRSGNLLIGLASAPFGREDLSGHSQRLYEQILEASRGLNLYRVWNYVPRINEATGGLENYRAFCRGRSLAFESRFGDTYSSRLSSASAVGCEGDRLETIFVAGEAAPLHVENPEQVPAYQYPVEHGPRSPSFSRATAVLEGNRHWVFVSGTAAIKGHATISSGALNEQIDCTLNNLQLISRASGVGDDLGASAGWIRHFKVYLRQAEDLNAAVSLLQRLLLKSNDRVTYLKSDICRAALDIEIEATLVKHG